MSTSREEIEMLLPWYANGTLGEVDRARVEAALAADPHLARSLEALLGEGDAVRAMAEATEPSPAMEARFLAQLAREPAAAEVRRAAKAVPGLAARAGGWLASLLAAATPQRLAYAAAALALVLVVQAGVIAALVTDGGGFRLASEDKPATDGPRLLVQFNETAPAGALAQELARLGARIVDGPAGGLFTLAFAADEKRPAEELAQILRQHPGYFRLVLPAK
jgi:anti-sigma-K factor RskA